jgi:glyoxalase family protein
MSSQIRQRHLLNGIHHITAITGSTKNNIRFYTEILGLRLVKRTVNYDSPDVWHFYYGNETGNPGSVITFFPFSGIPKGKSGNRSVSVIMYSVGEESLSFWQDRLKLHNIGFRGPFKRFDEEYLHLQDFDGLEIELVFNNQDQRIGWEKQGIPEKHAIKGIYSSLISYANFDLSADFLVRQMNHHILIREGDRVRLSSGSDLPGNFIDLISHPSFPDHWGGTGTVHHIAFNTKDEETQQIIKSMLHNAGIESSPVMDRHYFKSIYFREPGGVLFEIATSGPGFLVDEDIETLGSSLKLPNWMEPRRNEIESALSPLPV